MSRRPVAAACLLAVVVAGCGGSAAKHESFVAPKLASAGVGGLVRGYGDSAGTLGSYTPAGKILADSGFRPWTDGFSQENYGNDQGPQNMTAAQVEDIFGSQVCVSGTGKTCALIPPAKQWMENENAAMDGGHCMGFSVTALRMFTKSLKPQTYGAAIPYKLNFKGNLPLQETIAEDWIYQDLPAVDTAKVQGDPNTLLKKLEDALNDSSSETYTVGIFNATGGHAITPFAVEDRGSGNVNVLVYDNNFPGVTRTIAFNTDKDAWVYHGGPNPKELGETYQGDAHNKAMVLFPTSPGAHKQPCPFCGNSVGNAPRGYSVGTVLGKSEQYDEITLNGDPANHAHLLIEDNDGNRTGFVNGGYINEIPGAEIKRSYTIQNWNEAPEPSYQIPVGLAVRVTINGAGLTKTDKEELTLIGPGDYFDVSEIHIRPGQQDYVEFKGGGAGINYSTNAKFTQAPLIGGGLVDTTGGKVRGFYFNASAVGVAGQSSLSFILLKKRGLFGIDTAGTTGSIAHTGVGSYLLQMVRADPDGTTSVWDKPDLLLTGGKDGEVAVVQYRKEYAHDDDVQVIVRQGDNNPTFEHLKPDN